jgi:hypothetical protein
MLKFAPAVIAETRRPTRAASSGTLARFPQGIVRPKHSRPLDNCSCHRHQPVRIPFPCPAGAKKHSPGQDDVSSTSGIAALGTPPHQFFLGRAVRAANVFAPPRPKCARPDFASPPGSRPSTLDYLHDPLTLWPPHARRRGRRERSRGSACTWQGGLMRLGGPTRQIGRQPLLVDLTSDAFGSLEGSSVSAVARDVAQRRVRWLTVRAGRCSVPG